MPHLLEYIMTDKERVLQRYPIVDIVYDPDDMCDIMAECYPGCGFRSTIGYGSSEEEAWKDAATRLED